jgi:hypothetical protein
LCLLATAWLIRDAFRKRQWADRLDLLDTGSSVALHGENASESDEREAASFQPTMARFAALPKLTPGAVGWAEFVRGLAGHARFYFSTVLHISNRVKVDSRTLVTALAGYSVLLLAAYRFGREGQLAELILTMVAPALAIYYLPRIQPGLAFLPRVARADVLFWTTTARTFALLAFVLIGCATAELLNAILPSELVIPGSRFPARAHAPWNTIAYSVAGAFAAPLLVMLRMLVDIPAIKRGTQAWSPIRDFMLFLAFAFVVAWWYGAVADHSPGIIYYSLGVVTTGLVAHALLYILLRWRFTRTDFVAGRQ